MVMLKILTKVGSCKIIMSPMKRMFYTVASLLLLAGCCQNTTDQVTPPTFEEGHIFHATIEEGEESRVFLDSKIRIRWNAEDLITLFEGTTRNKQYIFLGEDGDNAGDFDLNKSGFGSGNPVERYYALYPYASTTKYVYGDDEGVADYLRYTLPSTQTYKEGSIGANANVMVAVTADLDDFDLLFRNVCSFLRVKLWGASQTVGSIVFEGNNGEALSGYAAVTPVYGGAPSLRMIGTGTSITLNCGNGVSVGTTKETATEFWLVVPPLNFPKGFTLTVKGFYGGSQTYAIPNNLTFARNTYNTITRELTIANDGTGMGVGGWGEGSSSSGSAE